MCCIGHRPELHNSSLCPLFHFEIEKSLNFYCYKDDSPFWILGTDHLFVPEPVQKHSHIWTVHLPLLWQGGDSPGKCDAALILHRHLISPAARHLLELHKDGEWGGGRNSRESSRALLTAPIPVSSGTTKVSLLLCFLFLYFSFLCFYFLLFCLFF